MNLSIEQINKDIILAIKAKNETATRSLRQLKTDMGAVLTASNAKKELSPTDIIEIIRKRVSRHEDSIKCFQDAGRTELVAQEEQEKAVLLAYLPPELSQEQINALVAQAISDVSATTKKDMGKAILRASELAKGMVDKKTLSVKISALLQ